MRKYIFSERRRINKKAWFFAILTILTLCYITMSQPIEVSIPIQRAERLAHMPLPSSSESEDKKESFLSRYRISPPRDVPYVALTFDDAPSAYTNAVLDALEAMGVQATFFVIGEKVKEYEDIIERMDAAGHDIGNHTYSHVPLNSDIAAHDVKEIRRCEQAIKDITGLGTLYVRPPFNTLSDGTAVALGEAGYRFCLYDLDSRDFFTSSTRRILENIHDVKPGDIIRLHDGHISPQMVKEIIIALRDKGLEPVTLRRLVTADMS